jgi:hypothetical protein
VDGWETENIKYEARLLLKGTVTGSDGSGTKFNFVGTSGVFCEVQEGLETAVERSDGN